MDQSAVESVQSAPGFDESLWEDLLVFIEEKCVIPVIGADLIQVECEGQQTPFYHWAAREVYSRLGLRPDPMPADYSLNDVMCAHLAAGGGERRCIRVCWRSFARRNSHRRSR